MIHKLSKSGHQKSRRVDSLTEAIAEAASVTGASPSTLSLKAKNRHLILWSQVKLLNMQSLANIQGQNGT